MRRVGFSTVAISLHLPEEETTNREAAPEDNGIGQSCFAMVLRGCIRLFATRRPRARPICTLAPSARSRPVTSIPSAIWRRWSRYCAGLRRRTTCAPPSTRSRRWPMPAASSPAEVKHYLLEQSTPLLLKIAATGPSVFARGDAVTALRDMGASRAVLDQAATIAEHDRDDYVRSRGEILRNFMKSMPAAGAAADVKSGGPREQVAIAGAEKAQARHLRGSAAPFVARRQRRRRPIAARCRRQRQQRCRLVRQPALLRRVFRLRRQAGRDRWQRQHRERVDRRRRRRQAQG